LQRHSSSNDIRMGAWGLVGIAFVVKWNTFPSTARFIEFSHSLGRNATLGSVELQSPVLTHLRRFRDAAMTDNESISDRSEISSAEAELIWDEYKYRHDLIWRHLIRSAVAVVALITVAYRTSFDENKALFLIAAALAVGYSIFNIVVVNSELRHYWRVKRIHQARQKDIYDLSTNEKEESHFSGFAGRVNVVLAALFLVALIATFAQICA